ncbi:MAG: DUF4070 domain-containing protein [Thermodesulfobacteriota bacterium]
MTRAILINPEYPTTFWSFKHVLRFVSKKAAYPPLGLLTVANMLPADWDLSLVDMNVEKLKDDDLAQADYAMIGAMQIQKKSVMEVLDRCRRLGVKVIAGGPLFNSTPDEFLSLVDHLILNEAELTLPPFLSDLANGTPKKVYRTDAFPDLSLTPVPKWELAKVKKYATLTIQSSRGCPFNCDFCDITNLFGRRPRLKKAEQLITELETIYGLGYRGPVFFVDDNFIGNKEEIKRILPLLIQWMTDRRHPFTFITEASINLADDDHLIELLVEAGFDTVFIGLETPNEMSLRECEKNQNLKRDMMAAIEKLQRAGLQVLGGYIVGFDHDDESIFARQMRFIQESGVVTAMVGLLNAMPNTKLWKRLKEENRLLAHASGDNTDGTMNFIPKMDREKLIEGYRRLVKTIYSPRPFYQRVSRFLERYRPRRGYRMRAGEIKALIRSILYLGVLGNGLTQWYYWKIFLKSILFYRRSFGAAITLMVYGHHFRKVAKKV